MRKDTKKYSLIYLDNFLKDTGIVKTFYKYLIDDSKLSMCIMYLDFNLRTQYVLVFRTSRLRYCVWHNGLMNIEKLRTCKDCGHYIQRLFADIISQTKYYESITVAELSQMQLDYNKQMELFRRTLKNKK